MADWQQLVQRYDAGLADALQGTHVEFAWEGGHIEIPGTPCELAADGTLTFRHAGTEHKFAFEMWNAYLANATVSDQIEKAKDWVPIPRGDRLFLFARYLPLPTAERLVDGGVDFLDLAGNFNLSLGPAFRRTIIGKKEPKEIGRPDTISAAHVQVLFTLAAHPDWLDLPVRELAEKTGISKSHVANVRGALLDRGLLARSRSGLQLVEGDDLERELVQSYDLILRPRLIVGRYRSQFKDVDALLTAMSGYFDARSTRWSLTGGLAAHRLRRFYQGTERTFFAESVTSEALRELRLLPDRHGDIVILRGFGDVCYWKSVKGMPLAHPWLIYTELLTMSDPRAPEAASDLRQGNPEWFSVPARSTK